MSWRFHKRETPRQERTKFKRSSKINIRREIKKLNKKYGEDIVTMTMRVLSKDEKYIKLPIKHQLEILKDDLRAQVKKNRR